MATEKIDALSLDITSQLNTDNLDKVIDKLSELGNALDRLKSKSVSVSLNQTANASNKLAGSFLNTAVKLTALIAVFRKFGKVISDSVADSANYIKSLNMFTVSMGEYADIATKYGQTVSNALGIDIAGWQKTQGIFQTLITGFGVTGEKAAFMSQNITQLTYDIASFYGITNEEAANKIKSALSGRLEPIRKLGYDLSQSKLVDIGQNPANYGKQTFTINKETGAIEANTVATDDNTKHKIVNFNQLTQQEKVQLRYIALMTQVTQVQGNYARALNDPANQLSVFRMQVDQTARAFGNMFIPALNKVLPYLSAFAQLATQAFQSLANLFGFKLPDMKDRTDISKNIKPYDKVVKATGNAAKNAKKMKDYMLGIDELNVFNPNSGAGGAGGAGGGENSNLKNLKLPGYDFLGKAVENSIKKAKENIDKLFAEWKKHPIYFPIKLMVEGAKKLGEKIWEFILGMTPEELRAEADKHGRTVGEQFWVSFKDSVGFVGSELWSVILGRTPEELKADAEAKGITVGEEFFNSFANKLNGQDLWELLWGTPDQYAKQAMDAGNTVGEQFFYGFSKKMLEWLGGNPLGEIVTKLTTGKSIDEIIAGLNKKLAPKTTKKAAEKAPSYVSADQAKKAWEIQTGANKPKVTNEQAAFVDTKMNINNAKLEANSYINAYANTLKSGKTKINKAANDGLFKSAYNGADNNGNGASQFRYVSAEQAKAFSNGYGNSGVDVFGATKKNLYDPSVRGLTNDGKAPLKFKAEANADTKAFYSNLNSSAAKTKAHKNAADLSSTGATGARSERPSYLSAGLYAGAGFIAGINDPKNAKEATKAGAIMGANTLIAIKKILGIESPSKEFYSVGKYSVEGYTNAITDNTKYAVDSVATMSRKVLDAVSNASNLSDKVILGGTIADPMASRAVSMPAVNSGYGIGAANEGAMANLASNIYQAVVSGMAGANIGNGNGGDIKVIIDGKEVFKVVQAESRKRGVAISNGTFSR